MVMAGPAAALFFPLLAAPTASERVRAKVAARHPESKKPLSAVAGLSM